MDFSTYLDQIAEAYSAAVYPPPVCWGKLSSREVLAALRRRRSGPGRIMLKLALPFCGSRCSFCDIAVPPEEETLARYLKAVPREMRLLKEAFAGREFFSLRVEGNAFSLSAQQLERVLAAACASFRLAPGHKSGLELNPASVTLEKARLAAGLGLDWAILGVQSLDPAVLAAAGCQHAGTDVEKKYGLLRRAGFKSVSMDLMFGLPRQTTASFIRDVMALVKMRPERIALYRCSRFSGSRSELDYVIDKGFGIMERAGYRFTKAFAPYSGVTDLALNETWPHACETGNPANAYSILSLGVGGRSYLWGRARYQNTKDIQSYIAALKGARLPVETGLALTLQDEMTAYLLLGLDCLRLIRLDEFESLFGTGLDEAFPAQLKALRGAGVIRRAADGYEVVAHHDEARHAARRALFPAARRESVEKRMAWIKTATY